MVLRIDGVNNNKDYNWSSGTPPADYLSLFGNDPNLPTLWYQTESFPRMNEAFARIWRNKILPSDDYDSIQRFTGFLINRLFATQNRNDLVFSQPTPLLLSMYYIKSSYKQREFGAAREGIQHLRDMIQIVRRQAGTNLSLYNAPDFSEFRPWDNRDEFRGWLIGTVEKIYNFNELETFTLNNNTDIQGMPELVSMLTRNNKVDDELQFAVWKYFLQSNQKGLYTPSNNFARNTELQASGVLNNTNYTVRRIENGRYEVRKGDASPVRFRYPGDLIGQNFSMAEVEHISNLANRVIFNPTLNEFAEMVGYTGNNRTLEGMYTANRSERYQKYHNELAEFHCEDLFDRYEFGGITQFLNNYYYDAPTINQNFLARMIQRKGLRGYFNTAVLSSGKRQIMQNDYRLRTYQVSEDANLLDQVEPVANQVRSIQGQALTLIENFDEDTDIFWLNMSKMMFLGNFFKISEQYAQARDLYTEIGSFDTVADSAQRRQVNLGLAESNVGLYQQTHNQQNLDELTRVQAEIYENNPTIRRNLPIDDQIRLIWMDVNIAAEQYNLTKIDRVIDDYLEPMLDRHNKMNILYPQILVARADVLGQLGRVQEGAQYLLSHNIPQWINTHVYNARARDVLNFKYELLLANFYIQGNEFEQAEQILNTANQRLERFRTENPHFYNGNFLKIRSLQLDLYWRWGRADKLQELYQPYSTMSLAALRNLNVGEREFVGKMIVKMMTMAVRRRDFDAVAALEQRFNVLGITAARKNQAEILIEFNLQRAEREKYYGRWANARNLINQANALLPQVKRFRQRDIYTRIVNLAYAHFFNETRNYEESRNYAQRLIYRDQNHTQEIAINPADGLQEEDFYFQGKIVYYQSIYNQGNYTQLAPLLRQEVRRAQSLLSRHSNNLLAQNLRNYLRDLQLLHWRTLNATYQNDGTTHGYENALSTINIVTREDKDMSLKVAETWFREKHVISESGGLFGDSVFFRVNNYEMQAGLAREYNRLEDRDNYFTSVIERSIPRLPILRERLMEIFGENTGNWPNLSTVFTNFSTGSGTTRFIFRPNARQAIRDLNINESQKTRLLELFRWSSVFAFGQGELDDNRVANIREEIVSSFINNGQFAAMSFNEKRAFLEGWIDLYMRSESYFSQARAALRLLYFGTNTTVNDPLIAAIRQYRNALPIGYNATRPERAFANLRLLRLAIEERNNTAVTQILTQFLTDQGGTGQLPQLLHGMTRRDSYEESMFLLLKMLRDYAITLRNMNISVAGSNLYQLIEWNRVRNVIERIENRISE